MTAEQVLAAGPVASWSDPATGVVEEAAYVGEGARILAIVHRPSAAARAAIVLCGSLFEDIQVNYRTEVLVARGLAARGVAACRFHYRGTGNSEPLPADEVVTSASMTRDARTASAWLTERCGVPAPGACGSKLGALVAADLVADRPRAPLVLWAPSVTGAAYFKGLSRANRFSAIRGTATSTATGGTKEEVIRADTDSYAEMLGHEVHHGTREDLSDWTLSVTPGEQRPVLLVQVAPQEELSPAHERLRAQWSDAGAMVEPLLVRARQRWTVPDGWESEDESPETQTVVSSIVAWCDRAVEATR